MVNKFTTPKWENLVLTESNPKLHRKIAKKIRKRCDLYWNDDVGALIKVCIKGQQLMLPVFQTKTEALSYSLGRENGFENIICPFKVNKFKSDYLKDDSTAYAVIGGKIKSHNDRFAKSNILH